MAQTWAAKAPTSVVERRWAVPLADDHNISTVTASASGVTVNSTDDEHGEAIVVLSGGTVETTGTVTLTVVTDDGHTHVATFYIPIRATAAVYTNTARDVCEFAMRKIAGVGVDMDSAELDVALECLNDMLALWRIDGPDIGIAKELVSTDVLTISESYLTAVKYNLAVLLAEEFDRPLTATLDRVARESKQSVATTLLGMADLKFERTLTRPKPMTSINDV